MKKALFTATVVRKHIMEFHIPYLKWFKNHGFETYVVAKNDYENPSDCKIPYCDHYINIDFSRNPISTKNIKAYKNLKEMIRSQHFDIIHCHTPVAGVLTRIAAKKARTQGTKVIYTAHGFHFFKGAPIQNWIVYYPIEKHCSKYTDALITINNEDYELAKSKFHAKNTFLVHGVGVTFEGRDEFDSDIRKEYKLDSNDFVICSVGELNKNKNHIVILESLLKAPLKDIDNVKYLLVGDGDLFEYYQDYVKQHNLQDKVLILGYRKDILSILKASDLFILPSLREGLPVALLEAMHCGLPCIVNNNRGTRDLVVNDKGGYICDNSANEYARKIKKLINDNKTCQTFGDFNKKQVTGYLLENVIKEYEIIYESLLVMKKGNYNDNKKEK